MPKDSSAPQSEWIRGVVDQFEGRLTLYASRIVGNVERARDVVQETFLRLCSQDQGRVESHLAQWLFTVCRNVALDVRRKEGRMAPLSETRAKSCPSPDLGPPEVLDQKESHSQALRMLETLSDNQQEVIRLKFQSGLSYREISGVTGLSESNVGFLIHTGLKNIRQKLAESFPIPQPRAGQPTAQNS